MADTPSNEPTVLNLTPVGQAIREAVAPPAPVLLPDGTALVPETKPQTIQEAIRAARENVAAKQQAAEGATPATEGTTETPAPEAGDATEDETDAPEASEGAEGEDAPDDALIVELPPRTPNGEPIRVAVPDQESLEAIQRLQNGYMRGEAAREVQAESRQVIEEFEEFREGMRLDPLSTIESALSVDQAELLVRSLLSHPALLPRLADDLALIAQGDEDAVARVRERAEAQRLKLKDKARDEIEGQRAVRQNARDVQSVIGRLVPESFTDEMKELFYRDARYDIQEWQQRNRQSMVPPNIVAQILAPRLKALGVDPATRRASKTGQPAPTRATPAAAAAPAGAPTASPQPRTVERVKSNAEKRALVAAAAPGANAVGRPNPLGAIPQNADVKEAIAAFRKMRRVG